MPTQGPLALHHKELQSHWADTCTFCETGLWDRTRASLPVCLVWSELRCKLLHRLIARAQRLLEGSALTNDFPRNEAMVTLLLGGTINIGDVVTSLSNWLWTACNKDMDVEDGESDESDADSLDLDDEEARQHLTATKTGQHGMVKVATFILKVIQARARARKDERMGVV